MGELLERLKRFQAVRLLYRIPFFSRAYHFALAALAAWWYGFPANRMTVVGVTGTKGKTTTANLIAHILQMSGRKTGMATTVNFRIGDREWVNESKQTMLGRFALQKLLREMADAGCRYAVIETSSEGILQYRHRFIDYLAAVFTNVSPEHIERHGSFENYRAAKVKLFEQVARKKDGIGVYNLDDPNVEHFLRPGVARKIGFVIKEKTRSVALAASARLERCVDVSSITLGTRKTAFRFGEEEFEMPLLGEFNVYNAASAIALAEALGVPRKRIQDGIRTARGVPGRFETVNLGQSFTIVIDYAHEPASLEALYQAVKLFKPKRIIGLLGAQGGGRDRWKRAAMGKIAAWYCDEIVLTNEDPYDEDPMAIIADVKKGVYETAKDFKPVYKIADRREAIHRALSLAKRGDAVVLSGKGGEVWMCVENDRKIAWNERQVVEEIVNEHADEFFARSGRNMRYETE